MTNARIIVQNDADSATLSASPALVATLPVTNLQETSRYKVARTTSAASQDIKGDFTIDRLISCCVLYRHNLTTAGTLRLILYSGAGQTGSTMYDSTATLAHPIKALGDLEPGYSALGESVFTGWDWYFSTLWFAPVWARSFKLTLADAANPAGYFQAARLVLGRHIEPFDTISYGVEMGWEENTKQSRTDGGSLRSETTEAFRKLNFSLERLTDGERARIVELLRSMGKRKDFFVSAFPGQNGAKERDFSMLAKMSSLPLLIYPTFGLHAAQFQVEET